MVAEKHKDIYMWMNGACIVFETWLLLIAICYVKGSTEYPMKGGGTAICCPLHPALLIFVGNPQAFPYPDFAH